MEEENIAQQPDRLISAPDSSALSPGSSEAKTQDQIELDSKIFAALSYLSILFVVPWIIKKDDTFVVFHVRQGMILFLAEIVIWFVLWLLESLLTTIFSFGAFTIMSVLYKLAWLLFAGVSIVGVYFAAKGKFKKLPILWILSKNLKI